MVVSSMSSPLALLVLALLSEHPMHVYGLHKLIHERGQDDLVNVVHRNSVRQAVDKLSRDGNVEIDKVQSGGAGPQRTVYRVTEQGRDVFLVWLRYLLGTPAHEYPVFPVAASLMAFLRPGEVAELLAQRRSVVAEERMALQKATDAATRLPEVLLVENSLRIRVLDAQLDWIDEMRSRIASGDLDWDTEALLEESSMAHMLEEHQ